MCSDGWLLKRSSWRVSSNPGRWRRRRGCASPLNSRGGALLLPLPLLLLLLLLPMQEEHLLSTASRRRGPHSDQSLVQTHNHSVGGVASRRSWPRTAVPSTRGCCCRTR